MGQTQCRRCGGQISTNSTTCPWCGGATTFNLVGPLILVLMLLLGVSFGLGLIRWEWLEQTLGLDRGFVDQPLATDAATSGGTGAGADLTWRLPPGPDPADNYAGSSRGPAVRLRPVAERPPAPPARIAAVVRARQSSQPVSPGGPGCADSSAVGRLVSRFPGWSNTDLALISCGRIRSGFSADQVRASLGKPAEVTRPAPGREQWRYDGISVLVEQGRVISYGQ
jgi:hypothetical protein